MNFLTKFSLKNSVAIFIISFLLIFGGLYSYSKLKVEELPNIEFPAISVQVVYPGTAPDDINEQITTKLENSFKSIEGIKTLSSSSFESVSVINLEFPFNTDMDKVEQQVNTTLKDAGLPENVTTKADRFSFGSFPIYYISMFSKDGSNIESTLNEEIVPALNKIEGVNSVSIGGGKSTSLTIEVDKQKIANLGLSLTSIKDQINAKFLSFPAGKITDGDIKIPIRVEEKLDTLQKLKDLELQPASFTSTAPNQNAQTPKVLLGEIAKIESVDSKDELIRYNENDAISMAITKKQDANTVEVADKVINVLNKYKNEISYKVGYSSAEGVKSSVESLIKEGLLGALFASLAVLIFLRNFRATFIAIISIPLSLLITSIFLLKLDITLNIMTLGGMAVAVGRVVDDSIVVIENIFRRMRKSKEGISNNLILSSTKEILKAVTSSTITTIVVFLPLGVVGGFTSKIFLPFALTIVFSLLASLLVSITIVPILGRYAFKKVPPEEKEEKIQVWYGKVIEKSLNRKWIIIVLAIVLLAGSFSLVGRLGFTFIPNESSRSIIASLELPSSTSLEKTNDVSLKMEKMFLNMKQVKEVSTGVGSRDFMTGLKTENKASYFINLKQSADVDQFIKDTKSKMAKVAASEVQGAKVGLQENSSGGPPSNNNVDINLYSNNLVALQESAKKVEDYMKKNDHLKYVTNNFSEKQKQVIVSVDEKKVSENGLSAGMILGLVADQTNPVNMGTLKIDGKDQNVQLTYNKELQSVEDIKNIRLLGKLGPIKLSDVAEVKAVETYSAIQKLDGKVFAKVSAQIKGKDIAKVTNEVIKDVKKDIDLPSDVTLKGGGGSDDTTQTFKDLGVAMGVAIGLVYLTMLITFGKARIPFIILSALVFVPIGSFVALFLAGEPLSISVMIGLLMLIGIVTTNAIVLVDRIGQNIEQKRLPLRQAIIEGGKTRLRPILMTAFATIAALLPLALTKSSGTLISKGLAITVIGGLTSSTLLTLVFIPVVYELFFTKRTKKHANSEETAKVVNH
ncbi:multidrug transporter AcrB [Bacillus sp. AFS077874]|uniref:efflux RND transporter permease subunit n=1 Tax=unclassified Bacillus (in: firmicutes) TaxID=185979 RepID=UPI000BEBCFEE|nr:MULTISPECIES: efflux RND transporter permease subunit [unclassified Bacillus (in: firmicutes)]PEC49945.1 multidrug transporter AcrB [Bacillus sp. AFS096315]PFM79381.1 multidrug transporter AcrB [Bacillus sp. AFS077874]